MKEIHEHGEHAYPEEGAGLLLGLIEEGEKKVTKILPLNNTREDQARHNRYLLAPKDYLFGEQEAARQGLDVLGVFHSHPDGLCPGFLTSSPVSNPDELLKAVPGC